MVNDVFSFWLQLLQELVRELKNAKADAIFMMVAIENVGWGRRGATALGILKVVNVFEGSSVFNHHACFFFSDSGSPLASVFCFGSFFRIPLFSLDHTHISDIIYLQRRCSFLPNSLYISGINT